MTLIEDTRQQARKHENKRLYFEQEKIRVIRSKLPIGDYALINDMSVVVDTKKDIQEIIGNVTQEHARFVSECRLALDNGIKLVVLIEDKNVKCIDDLNQWKNPRLKRLPKATTGSTLAKILSSIERNHGAEFQFCTKEECGKRIIEILTRGKGVCDA